MDKTIEIPVLPGKTLDGGHRQLDGHVVTETKPKNEDGTAGNVRRQSRTEGPRGGEGARELARSRLDDEDVTSRRALGVRREKRKKLRPRPAGSAAASDERQRLGLGLLAFNRGLLPLGASSSRPSPPKVEKRAAQVVVEVRKKEAKKTEGGAQLKRGGGASLVRAAPRWGKSWKQVPAFAPALLFFYFLFFSFFCSAPFAWLPAGSCELPAASSLIQHVPASC